MTAAPSRPSPPAHVRARGLWNLLNLATPLGLVGAVVAGCALRPGPHGLIEARGWTHRFPGGAAFTVGDVVFTRPGLRMTPALWRHEAGHADQYALLLGLPFLLIAAAYERWAPVSAWLRRRQRAIQIAGAVLLITVGLLLLTGGWDAMTQWLQIHLISDTEVIL